MRSHPLSPYRRAAGVTLWRTAMKPIACAGSGLDAPARCRGAGAVGVRGDEPAWCLPGWP